VSDADLLSVVLYFDVFNWPLTRPELVRFVAPSEPEAIDRVCERLIADGTLGGRGPFVHLPGKHANIERRQRSAQRAEQVWPAARRAAAVLARMPFVRGVLITGGLSKGAADEDSDVDFLLVVEPGRVWITKSLLQVFRRSLPPRIRECFCTNYLIAADRLLLDDRTMYTAVELLTAVPMYGRACAELVEANAWARSYIPGFDAFAERARNAPELPPRPAAAAIERALVASGDRAVQLDRGLLAGWSAFWDRKYARLDPATRAQRFKRRPEVATNHLDDFQFRVLEAWTARRRDHGLAPPDHRASP
jgi:hypothetical protein